jgi:hypothetical protein
VKTNLLKHFCALFIFASTCTLANAQSLKGRIIASDTRKPVVSANVFLSNTSIGTTTNENGEFILQHFPAGRYDMVVSFIGYESYTISVQSNKLPDNLDIVIKPKINELQEVILEPYEKNGWEKWGTFFLENFIGTSQLARDCKLLNKDVLKFRMNRKTNTLRVSADDRLQIENRALGYNLKYDLVSFEFNFGSRVLVYQGCESRVDFNIEYRTRNGEYKTETPFYTRHSVTLSRCYYLIIPFNY